MEKTGEKQNGSRDIVARPPIVVVVGHIDHGKSKILETVRKTKMLETEAGGITQHIGAYVVEHKGRKITFIDTPGHEAFSRLRSRGAKVADIAILVVAADEGVKPQAREAVKILQENSLPFVVALNKVDKPEANPEKVKKELAENGVLVESYGGKVPSIEVSAKTGKNLDELLDLILLVAELENLEANSASSPEGVIIETHRDPKRGITATLLVQNGTIRLQDFITVGKTIGSIKILEDFAGKSLEEVAPSSPALVAGLSELPAVGEKFHGFRTRREAEKFVETLPEEAPSKPTGAPPVAEPKEGGVVFNLVLKTDVTGSKEALGESLEKIGTEGLRINILRSGVGNINESDVKLALATKLVTLVGFKVRVDASARSLAEKENIRIVTGEVIYEVLDEVKKRVEEMLPPEVRRTDLGLAKILKLFKKEGKKQVVGGRVEEGLIREGAVAEIRRRKEVVGHGAILELQQNKQKVKEVEKGLEFGALVESDTEIQEGDIIDIFEEEVIKRSLSWHQNAGSKN